MADTIKISGLPEKTTIAETDFLVGNVGTGSDATGRVEIDALRTRLNISNQTIVGNITHTGSQTTSANIKAATFEGNGALLTGIVAAGTGGTSSIGSLSLVCNSANGTPAAKIVGSKYSQDLWEADENGFKVRTGIPYTHEDASIPFDKDLKLNNKQLLQSQTILNQHPFPYYSLDGVDDKILVANNTNVQFLDNDFTIAVRFKANTANILMWKKAYSTDPGVSVSVENASGAISVSYRVAASLDLVGSINVKDNKWHKAIITFVRNGLVKIYVDGVLDPNTMDISSDPGSLTAYNLGIAYAEMAPYYSPGDIGEYVQYNKALSETEAIEQSSNPLMPLYTGDEYGSNAITSAWVSNASYPFETCTIVALDLDLYNTSGYGIVYMPFNPESGYNYKVKFTIEGAALSTIYFTVAADTNLGSSIIVQSGVSANGDYEFDIAGDATTNYLGFYASDGVVAGVNIRNLQILKLGATFHAKPQGFGARKMVDYANGNDGAITSATVKNKQIQADLDVRQNFLVPRLTTAEKSALTAYAGQIVYDTTLDKFQGFEGSTPAWTSFI